tara:strand:+ start:1432 stop:1839 length:408 start_codon:yes stop_codon:yes gene_type:complete
MEGKTQTMEELFKGIEKEKEERFRKTWSKLDKGSKLNRIHLFIKTEKIDKELNDSQEKQLKTLLLRIFETGGLNKASEIDYSQETYQIESIKNLNFNEETNKYDFVSQLKKKKIEGGKSKSNVERHFSRSKETKR